MFSSVGYQLLIPFVLKPRYQFIHISPQMQRLVVLAQPMLRHMDRHSDTQSVWPFRVLPLQLTQGNRINGLPFLPRSKKYWFLETTLEGPMIYPEH
jgi:hypothetical protein